MTIDQWEQRPAEIAHILNPAFTGAALRLAIDGYFREAALGMPFALSFLVLPLSLHKGTIDRLPLRVTSYLPQWLQDNRDMLINFSNRTRTLVPYTREGIIFAAQRKVIAFDDNGLLRPGSRKLRGKSAFLERGNNVSAIMKRATFVGRWLAVSGSPATLYSVLGVTP